MTNINYKLIASLGYRLRELCLILESCCNVHAYVVGSIASEALSLLLKALFALKEEML